MVRCIGGAKMTMTATIVTRLANEGSNVGEGTYERYQDEDSGEILQRFIPAASAPVGSRIFKAEYDIPCFARGYTDLGFRSSANRESVLKGDYSIFEAIEFTYPGRYNRLTRQSYITKIVDTKTQTPLWVEEETGQSTVFQVQGMTPLYDPFGKLREWTGVVIRSEIQ
jgi:hypothetical protein